jgi:hypothetical protein
MRRCHLAVVPLLASLLLVPQIARSVDVPPEGSCPPYPLEPGEEAPPVPGRDVVPPRIQPGARLDLESLAPLGRYLPPEVWARRDLFFHEGMVMEVGPCHRRYPAPAFFRNATQENLEMTRLDDEGNLLGYTGQGLPFDPEGIDDDAADAGQKWAWNYRYRYMGAGFRGEFRLIEVNPRQGKGERFEGTVSWLPLHGVPGIPNSRPKGHRFAGGGKFTKPPISRGVAWRQLVPEATDRDYQRSDDIFVYIPDQRRMRRAPPQSIDGIFVPSYTLGRRGDGGVLSLPDGGHRVPDSSLAVVEHTRRGFEGLTLRPNAYRFHLMRIQDVLAPINSNRFGYPSDPERPYGPTGLSLATDRWELRRAVVLKGRRRDDGDIVASATMYVDALTAQPLYFVTRRENHLIHEVGILMGRFSADDPLQPDWEGSGDDVGVIQPVAAAFFVSGGGSWLRESFDVRSDPPGEDEFKELTTTIRLQRGR